MSDTLIQAIIQRLRANPYYCQLTPERLQRIVETAVQRFSDVMVIMEQVQNPHNLAAIARSCDAFGVQQLAAIIKDSDLTMPLEQGDISARSANQWLDYRFFSAGTEEALTTLKAEGWHIMATTVHEHAQSINEVDFTKYEKLALLVGNEQKGVSPQALALADSFLYIPMMGMVTSFNVSVAAALCLFEINRQRRPMPREVDAEALYTLAEELVRRALPPRNLGEK